MSTALAKDQKAGQKLPGDEGGPLTPDHKPMHTRHVDDQDWTMLRYEGQLAKMLFHPTPDEPNVPNAGLVHYEPGSGHPLHNHYFAQVWYVLEGEFVIEGKTYGVGSMIYHPDPHYEYALTTKTGGTILFVQYMGPTTRKAPIYDGRFNVTKRKRLEEETTKY